MYHNGDGVPLDYAEAVRWYRLAADQGYVNSQDALGRMYGLGEGVPRDYVLAYMWFNLAAAQENGEDSQVSSVTSQDKRDMTAERMTREQIAEAQRLSREWLEAHPPDGD
jgi:TPR repeat protein